MQVTSAKAQELMEIYIQSLESALYSAYQTYVTETRTACSLAYWIASFVPADDSWKHIPKSDGWDCIYVEQGTEGADIIIERL